MMAMLKSSYSGFRKIPFRVLLITWSVLIILSTMFIKQHSIFDVLTALALIAICYIRIYKEKAIFRFRKWDKFALRIEAEAMQAEAERKKRKENRKA
jgi:membrane-associated phospholipid phosphatase